MAQPFTAAGSSAAMASTPMASEAFPIESHVPRSFVDYQLARSAQTRYVLGTLHSDAQLAAGTDLSRHFTCAPAQPTAWSSGQETVLPWQEADSLRHMAARNVQRIHRGQSSRCEDVKQAPRMQTRETSDSEDPMQVVDRAREERAAAATQIQAIKRGAGERQQLALGGLSTQRREGDARDALAADAELDPLVAKVRAQ